MSTYFDQDRLENRFLQPKSLAVFGGARAEEVIRQSLNAGYQGEIWPVHPSKKQVLGLKAYASVAELPASPDASYLAVNRHHTVNIVAELAARQAGGVVCFATGFSESNDIEGVGYQQALLEASGDMPLLGPNCYGLLNYKYRAMLWPDQQGGQVVDRGVAIISMSSNVAFNLNMQQKGLPLAYMLSLGNKLKIDLHDAIKMFARQPHVSAIGLYIESVSDPHQLLEAARLARSLGKPIVAMKVGSSSIAQQITISHTASLAGSDALIGRLLERAGIARVHSLETMVETLKVLHLFGPLPQSDLAVMSTSGGDCAIIADAIDSTILNLPALNPELQTQLSEVLHPEIKIANPLDYQMFDWGDRQRLLAMIEAFSVQQFGLVLSLIDLPRADRCNSYSWQAAIEALKYASGSIEKPQRLALMSTFSDNLPESLALELIQLGVLPLAGIVHGTAGLNAAAQIGRYWQKPMEEPLFESRSPSVETHVLNEFQAKTALADFGLSIPRHCLLNVGESVSRIEDQLKYPLVVKALGIAHKTEHAAVRLNIHNQQQLQLAVTAMHELSNACLIEEMVEGCVAEMIIGCNRDPQFGLYLVLGAGGVLVELLQDSICLLLPTSREVVREALAQLKVSRLLSGYRNGYKADTEGLIDNVMQLANFVQEYAEHLDEIDINPLMVLAEGRGSVIADALIKNREGI